MFDMKTYTREYQRRYDIKYPWRSHYNNACQRCHHPSSRNYHIYKDMQFNMTLNDFKELWFRDKAYLLKQASIHRIDNKKGYIKSNCQFIELDENRKIGGYKKGFAYWKGKKLSFETRRKMKLAKIGHPSGMKGKKMSQEFREKCRQRNIKRIQLLNSSTIRCEICGRFIKYKSNQCFYCLSNSLG